MRCCTSICRFGWQDNELPDRCVRRLCVRSRSCLYRSSPVLAQELDRRSGEAWQQLMFLRLQPCYQARPTERAFGVRMSPIIVNQEAVPPARAQMSAWKLCAPALSMICEQAPLTPTKSLANRQNCESSIGEGEPKHLIQRRIDDNRLRI